MNEDFPKELEDELKLSRDTNEKIIINSISDNGGTADINQILIAIYKNYGKVFKRRKVQEIAYRLKRKGLLKIISNGFYGLKEIDNE